MVKGWSQYGNDQATKILGHGQGKVMVVVVVYKKASFIAGL